MAHEWLALHHAFAAAAGFLHPGDLDHLDLRSDHVQQLADIFADDAQVAAAVGTGLPRIELATLARRALGDAGAAALGFLGCALGLLGRRRPLFQGLVLFGRRVVGFRRGHPQVLERQFELLDLALDLFGAGSEGLLLELRDPDPQRLHEEIVGAQGRLQSRDDLLQRGRVIGHIGGRLRHAHA